MNAKRKATLREMKNSLPSRMKEMFAKTVSNCFGDSQLEVPAACPVLLLCPCFCVFCTNCVYYFLLPPPFFFFFFLVSIF